MTELPEGFYIHDVYCYGDATLDRWSFYYIPGVPQPELNAYGKPTISLWASARGAILQLQARWDVETNLLKELKQELAKHHPELDADLISIELAPIISQGVTLAIGDGNDKFQDLATVNSSEVSPYSTIFNLRLTATEKAKALSALNGHQNYLAVKYKFSLEITSAVETTIAGDLAADIAQIRNSAASSDKASSSSFLSSWLRRENHEQAQPQEKNISLQDCLAQIETALSDKRLHLSRVEINRVSDELRQTVDSEAKHYAAQQLLNIVKGRNPVPHESPLQVTARQTETHRYSLERQTDVSSWFPTGNGSDYVQVSPTPIDEPDRSDDTDFVPSPEEPEVIQKVVRLAFAAEDLPISSIKVTCGEVTETLQRPNFKQITLPATGEPLLVETKYTKAGKTFQSELPPTAEEWLLTPEILGIAKISVDGTTSKTAKVKNAQVTVYYKPAKSGDGVRESRTINFQQGDAEWIASWYVITRSTSLNGVIEWFWVETPARGAAIKHKSLETDNPVLKL